MILWTIYRLQMLRSLGIVWNHCFDLSGAGAAVYAAGEQNICRGQPSAGASQKGVQDRHDFRYWSCLWSVYCYGRFDGFHRRPHGWLRLSIIGAAATELSAATMGAQAAGVEFGGEGYTLTIMAVSWFAMALNGAGWLVVSGTITPALEKLRGKLSGGDTKWLAVLSGACSLGIFGYLNANEIVKGLGNTIACLAGALSMVAIMKWVVPKHPKIAEYSLGIAMIIGMFFAVILIS